jgi:hypothetical protein
MRCLSARPPDRPHMHHSLSIDLLQLTKLYTIFDIYDDEKVAVASFK